MDRVSAANYVTNGAGKRQFADANPGADTAGTDLAADWHNGVQEEIIGGIIEWAGLTPSDSSFSQMQQALILKFGRIPGEVIDYAGATVPANWLLCDGQAVSRTTYAALFAAIGTTWGAGDGSSTFNVPDLRGRTTFGADAMGGTAANRLTSASIGTAAALGVSGGDQELQSHAHSITDPGHAHGITDPGHVHGYDFPANLGIISPTGSGQIQYDPQAANTNTATTGITINSATTSVTVNASGSGGAQNVPPMAVVNKIIYAA